MQHLADSLRCILFCERGVLTAIRFPRPRRTMPQELVAKCGTAWPALPPRLRTLVRRRPRADQPKQQELVTAGCCLGLEASSCRAAGCWLLDHATGAQCHGQHAHKQCLPTSYCLQLAAAWQLCSSNHCQPGGRLACVDAGADIAARAVLLIVRRGEVNSLHPVCQLQTTQSHTLELSGCHQPGHRWPDLISNNQLHTYARSLRLPAPLLTNPVMLPC